jgi:hypothetical protein
MFNLKSFLTFSLLMITALCVSAQDKPTPAFEVGLNLVDYNRLTLPSASPVDSDENFSFVTGLFVKKHAENKSYRMGFNYKSLYITYQPRDSRPADSLYTTGDYTRTNIFAGFEKTFFKRKFFETYWGMDLSMLIAKYNSTLQSYPDVQRYTVSAKQHGAGLSPIIGARFTMAERIRLSVETKMNALFYVEDENVKSINDPRDVKNAKALGYENDLHLYATVSYLF